MYVEFIGLPGAGKTTLRNRLIAQLKSDGQAGCLSAEDAFLQVARRRIDRVFRVPLNWIPAAVAMRVADKLVNRSLMQHSAQNEFLARHGTALEAFLSSETYNRMSLVDRSRVIGHFLTTGSYLQCLLAPDLASRVTLCEEGLVQKSLMFVDRSRLESDDSDHIVRYLQNIPAPDLLVWVTASRDTSWQRMLGRPDGLTDRLKDADESETRKFLDAVQAHMDFVTDWFEKEYPGRLAVYDSEANDSQQFLQLLERIRDLKPQPAVDRKR